MSKYFLKYQQNWLADNSKIKIWEKSRRIGASYVQAYEDVRDCIDKAVPDVWFSSADMTAAREYILYCEKYAKVFDAGAKSLGETVIDKEKDVKAFTVEFSNGTRINALSSNPTQFRSKGGKVILDEFGHHENPEELWKAALPCITWGFPLRILSTHNGTDSLFYNFCQDVKTGKKDWSLHKTTIYNAVDDGIVDKIYKRVATTEEREAWIESVKDNCFDDLTWLQEYCCEAGDGGTGNVVQRFINDCIPQNGEWIYSPESNVRPVNYINDADLHITCDFNKNPNSWILAHKTESKVFFFDEIVIEHHCTEENIALFCERYPNHKGKIIINGDCSGRQDRSNSKYPEYVQMINYLQKFGYKNVEIKVPYFNPDRHLRVAAWNQLIRDKHNQPHILIDPKCEWLIYNCENLKKIAGSNKFKEATVLQIEKNPKLKYLAHPFDGASYHVYYYFPVKREHLPPEKRPLTLIEQFKQSR
jgi:hypothetical protein